MSVFVTGPTGTVGSSVVQHLLARGSTVTAGLRNPDEASTLPAGCRSRHFDFTMSKDEMRAALAGCRGLFLMRPPAIADVERYLFPVIDAARDAGIDHIVFLSLQGVQMNRRTPHHAVEKHLRRLRAPYTFVRPNFFSQNLADTYAERIRERHEIFVPAGHSRTAFIDARDIGRVAATVFTEPGHLHKAYTLSGEESLTYKQIAKRMSQILGRPIVYSHPSEEEYLAALEDEGAPPDYIAVQRMIHRVVRLNISACPNRVVRRLTGKPATPFTQFVRDYADTWKRDPAASA